MWSQIRCHSDKDHRSRNLPRREEKWLKKGEVIWRRAGNPGQGIWGMAVYWGKHQDLPDPGLVKDYPILPTWAANPSSGFGV